MILTTPPTYCQNYLNELGKECAKAATNNQVKNLRIVNRDYILGEFAKELKSKLVESGLGECKVLPITTKMDGSPIAHRQRFYHVGGVNYELNHPSTIAFCPTGGLRDKMRLDYEAMKTSMIYGGKLSFDALIDRLEQLENRFRAMPM